MRMAHLTLLAFLVGISGCHSQPPERAPAPVGAEKLSSSAINNDYVKMGYHPVVRKDGQTVYCRTEMVTDSHFTNKVCLTEAQLQEQAEKQRAGRDQLFR